MARIDKTVFISYRRTNVPWVLAISQNLTNNGFDVFFDYTGLASGDFEGVILDNIHARAHFLILLTPSALERCGDPGDWLRREIEEALDSKRNIVPLMLEGFDFGNPSIGNQLTGKLAVLRKYNAMTVSAEYFGAAMDKLRKFLNVALETVVHPASPVAAHAAAEEKVALTNAPAVAEEELTAQQWFERGLSAKNSDEKVRFFSNAIRDKPDFAQAYYHRGNSRRINRDLQGALEDFEHAINFNPTYVKAIYNRGIVRRMLGDLESALRDCTQAISLKPDFSRAINQTGSIRHEKGDLDGALNDFDEAIRINPNYADAFNNRARTRRAQGDLQVALQDCTQAITLSPNFVEAFIQRGSIRQQMGDLDGALSDYDKAIHLKPDFVAAAFYNRGTVHRTQGDLDGSLADYKEAIRLKPDYSMAIKDRDTVLKAIADRSKS